MRLIEAITLFLFWLAVVGPACGDDERIVRIATTTTTDNSGLIKILMPAFEALTHFQTRVIAVGTGKALQLLANGDVEVSLTHAQLLENELIETQQAINRTPVMYNDFIVVGPATDPAGLRDARDAVTALAQVARREWTFVSRGDESGTHAREKSLWRASSAKPQGYWYRETGQGMGQTLRIAGELDGYALTDRGTWLAYRASVPLAIVFQGDSQLLNLYSVMSANPAKHSDLNHSGAAAFVQWLLSSEAAKLIRNFTIDGQLLFVPLLRAGHE